MRCFVYIWLLITLTSISAQGMHLTSYDARSMKFFRHRVLKNKKLLSIF